MVENILAELRDIQVRKPVVVIVAPDAAQTIPSAGNPGICGNVGKSAISIIVVNRIAGGNPATVEIAAVHEVDVLPAVTVKVCHAEARSKDFPDDGDPLVSGIVDEFDSSFVCDVRKLHTGGG